MSTWEKSYLNNLLTVGHRPLRRLNDSNCSVRSPSSVCTASTVRTCLLATIHFLKCRTAGCVLCCCLAWWALLSLLRAHDPARYLVQPLSTCSATWTNSFQLDWASYCWRVQRAILSNWYLLLTMPSTWPNTWRCATGWAVRRLIR